jgi:hypothetical protein
MKKLMLGIVLFFLLAVTIPLSSETAATDNQEVAVSRINSVNGQEFIEIYNFSPENIDIMRLNVRAFSSTGTQRFSKNFDVVTFSANGFILIAQGGTADNSDDNYALSSNNITPSGGKIEIYFDQDLVSEICWGSTLCADQVTISDSQIFISDACLANQNCSSATVRFGGVKPADMCQFDSQIFASDEDCVEPPPVAPHQLVISEIAARLCPDDNPNCSNDQAKTAAFIEIYNNSPNLFNASGWKVQYASATSTNNYQAGTFTDIAVISQPIEGFEWATWQVAVGNSSDGYLRIVDQTGQVIDLVGWGRAAAAKGGQAASSIGFNNSIQRCELPDANGYLIDSGNNAGDFATYTRPSKDANVACAAPEPVNYCAGLELSEIAANVDNQFIEIHNPTAMAIEATDCQLATNRNNNLWVFDGILPAGGYLTTFIKDTTLTLTKTTTGTVYLLSSDGQKEIDSTSYSGLSKETSWSLVDGIWRQTYQLTPDAVNVWVAYPACPEGQERNPETGRCRKIAEPEVLAACPDGQYRNPLTNRCKKYEIVATLAPCKEGYERNPLTNRCRKIVTEEDELKPCAEGWERNPETNRCRKKVSTEPAAFAVKSGDPTGGSTMYMLTGASVILLTAAVVLFQFRLEIAKVLRRLHAKFLPIKQP